MIINAIILSSFMMIGENEKMSGSYYEIITNGCRKGYAFVRDYMGNKCYYGTMKQCKQFINDMMKIYGG